MSVWRRFAAGLLIVAGSGVQAEAPPTGAAPEQIARWLATEGCLGFMEGEFDLVGNAELKRLGFSERLEKSTHPRVGDLSLANATYTNGSIGFGGVSQSLCMVVATGPVAAAALPGLSNAKSALNFKFERDAGQSRRLGENVEVETFKAPLNESAVLYVQVVDASKAANPAVTYQLMAMEN